MRLNFNISNQALRDRFEAIAQITERGLTPRDENETEPAQLINLRNELAFYQTAPGDRAQKIITELKSQIFEIEGQLQTKEVKKLDNSDLLQEVFADSGHWRSLEKDEKRQIYHALIEKVVVRDGAVREIVLNV